MGGDPGGDPGGAGRRTRSEAHCIPQVPIPGCHQPPLRNGVSRLLLPGGGERWGCPGSAEGTRTSGHGTFLPSSPRPGPWRRRGEARRGQASEALGRADEAIGEVPGDQSAAMSLLPAPVPGLPRGPGWLAGARHAAGAPRPLPELRRTWRRRRERERPTISGVRGSPFWCPIALRGSGRLSIAFFAGELHPIAGA